MTRRAIADSSQRRKNPEQQKQGADGDPHQDHNVAGVECGEPVGEIVAAGRAAG
jgi:hypothetical protein